MSREAGSLRICRTLSSKLVPGLFLNFHPRHSSAVGSDPYFVDGETEAGEPPIPP
jgi:hypothetical protein